MLKPVIIVILINNKKVSQDIINIDLSGLDGLKEFKNLKIDLSSLKELENLKFLKELDFDFDLD